MGTSCCFHKVQTFPEPGRGSSAAENVAYLWEG